MDIIARQTISGVHDLVRRVLSEDDVKIGGFTVGQLEGSARFLARNDDNGKSRTFASATDAVLFAVKHNL